ncbi:MAG TPA: hypothetical protein VGF67_19090 [Ktedonobacteraceae bacterium]
MAAFASYVLANELSATTRQEPLATGKSIPFLARKVKQHTRRPEVPGQHKQKEAWGPSGGVC